MNIHINITLCILLSFLNAYSANAQVFSISNGSKTKEIKDDHIIDLTLVLSEGKEKCCSFIEVEGFIIGAEKDSIKVKVNKYTQKRSFEENAEIDDIGEIGPITSFATDDIYSLKIARSKRAKAIKDKLFTTSAFISVAGVVTAINAIFVTDNQNRRNFFIVGGAEVLGGLTMGAILSRRTLKFQNTSRPWKFIETP